MRSNPIHLLDTSRSTIGAARNHPIGGANEPNQENAGATKRRESHHHDASDKKHEIESKFSPHDAARLRRRTTPFTCRAGCKERSVAKSRHAGPVRLSHGPGT